MPMESETIYFIYFGFIFVIVIALITLIRLYFFNRNRGYIWFVAQLFFLVVSFHKFMQLIKPKSETLGSMASEVNSLTLAAIGICWAISMMCMVIGIDNISTKMNKERA